MEVEPFAGEMQLAEKPVERGTFLAGGRTVGHGVQPRFKQPPLPNVKRIQPAGKGVLFDDQRFSAETGGTDTGRESRQASSDDNELILSHVNKTGG